MDHVLRARRCAPAAVYNRRKKFCQHEADNAQRRFIMDAGRSLTADCALKEHLNFRSGLKAGPGTNIERMKIHPPKPDCNRARVFFCLDSFVNLMRGCPWLLRAYPTVGIRLGVRGPVPLSMVPWKRAPSAADTPLYTRPTKMGSFETIWEPPLNGLKAAFSQ